MNPRRKQPRTVSPLECASACVVAFLCFAWVTSEPTQVILLGALICFCAGYGLLEFQEQKKERRGWNDVLATLPVPFALATEPGFFKEYVKIAESMTIS